MPGEAEPLDYRKKVNFQRYVRLPSLCSPVRLSSVVLCFLGATLSSTHQNKTGVSSFLVLRVVGRTPWTAESFCWSCRKMCSQKSSQLPCVDVSLSMTPYPSGLFHNKQPQFIVATLTLNCLLSPSYVFHLLKVLRRVKLSCGVLCLFMSSSEFVLQLECALKRIKKVAREEFGIVRLKKGVAQCRSSTHLDRECQRSVNNTFPVSIKR